MNIGIEAERANHASKTGVEHYAQQLILHLARLNTGDNFTLYLRTQPQEWFSVLPSNFKVKVIPFPKFWTQVRLSWEMLWHAPDLLFIPASALPLFHPRRSVVTIHDTAWVNYPEAFTPFMRRYLHWSTKFAVRSAFRVIAVSEATRQDLIKYYKVAPEKVAVVPHGYEVPPAINENVLSAEVAAKLPEKYVLFLSTLQPRKNVIGLIEAFAEMKRENPELPHKLVIVGKPGWKFGPILEKIEQHRDIVIYLNHISDSDRWPVYRKADLFVHPSFYEGFGMWLLEAFACGTPAAVSNISSLPEVGGDAALYFDPHNRNEIKNTMLKILTNPALAAELVARGRQRVQLYSWERCAKETMNVFKNV
jgi:glycosyltransferase involved in cell wall biosynthesis